MTIGRATDNRIYVLIQGKSWKIRGELSSLGCRTHNSFVPRTVTKASGLTTLLGRMLSYSVALLYVWGKWNPTEVKWFAQGLTATKWQDPKVALRLGVPSCFYSVGVFSCTEAQKSRRQMNHLASCKLTGNYVHIFHFLFPEFKTFTLICGFKNCNDVFYQREIRNLKGNHLFEPDLLPPGGPLGVTAWEWLPRDGILQGWESGAACSWARDHFIVLISVAFIILQGESWMLPGESGEKLSPRHNGEPRQAPTYSAGFLLSPWVAA